MVDPYIDKLTGYETKFDELKDINHIDLVNIIEGTTGANDDVRQEAISIFNELYPNSTGYNLEDIFAPVPKNPLFDDPLHGDLL